MNLSEPFVRRPIGTALLTFGVALAGAAAFFLLPVAPLPSVDIPTVFVQASLPGASPETMSTSVATPLERHLGHIADVSQMTSSSRVGSSTVVLQFGLERDIDGAARDVQAAINAGGNALIPAGVTTGLIGRRADIVAARARIEEQASRIKVARADFYPDLRVNALIGLQALPLGQLLTGGSAYGSVGPAISLPLFHGGALRAAYRGARADYDLAVADYDRTILAAYQQVADAVTTRAYQARQLDDARAAASASEEAYSIATARYRGGLSTYIEALTVEDQLVQARQALALANAAYRTADISLVRALGGGYAEDALAAKDHPHD